MAVTFLLDENVEHEVHHRLETLGYDVTHVETHPELGKGAEDASLAEFSRTHGRVIVTYDADFVIAHEEADYHGTVYFADEDLSAAEVSDVLHTMASTYPDSAFRGLEFGSREWL